jgi:NTP pyrophosphatase (non-canonical NTP hydrolase)
MRLFEETLQLWGIKAQIYKFSEEVGELLVAIHHWYDDKATKEELAEEIADVEIMCSQFRHYIGSEVVNSIKTKKLIRLRERVDSAKEKKASGN